MRRAGYRSSRDPGVVSGFESNALVSQLDVAPTTNALAPVLTIVLSLAFYQTLSTVYAAAGIVLALVGSTLTVLGDERRGEAGDEERVPASDEVRSEVTKQTS